MYAYFMRVLSALVLTDDRPGHYHLSDGVIAAARRLRPVEVMRLQVRRRWSGRLLALLSNARCRTDWLLRLAYGLPPANIPQADLIVSAGAETLAASIAIARLTGAPNIFCGTLRGFHEEGLRLVLTSYASHAKRPRHIMVLKPSPLNRGALAGCPKRLTGGALPPTMGLLLGGDSRECRFDADDWEQLFGLVEHSHRALGIRWVVSNSPRTPQSVSNMVAARAAANSNAIGAYIDVRVTGPGTLDRVLRRAQAVVCTDDSSTMISECVSAGLPVIGLRPRRSAFTSDEQAYRRYLTESGWYRSVAIAELTPDKLLHELSGIRPLTEDPLDRLAAILRERLPELFSGRELSGNATARSLVADQIRSAESRPSRRAGPSGARSPHQALPPRRSMATKASARPTWM